MNERQDGQAHENYDELRARLDGLADALGSLAFVAGTSAERRGRDGLERARRLVRSKLLAELERGFSPPLLVTVAGGTNVGKSSLFNAILSQQVSSVDARAGHTVSPVAAGPAGSADALRALLPGYEVTPVPPGGLAGMKAGGGGDARTAFLAELDSAEGPLLFDSPDVDSALRVNRARADDVLVASDVLLLVTSPTKYNDKRCVEFLLDAAAMGKRVAVLFNLLPPEPESADGGQPKGPGPEEPRREILEDFRRTVLAKLPGGSEPPALFGFDALAGPATSEEERAAALAERALEARAHLRGEAARAGAVKREVASGGARYLSRSLEGTIRALREQAASLEAVRARIDEAGARAAADYEAFQRRQQFLDLDLVLRRLTDRFRVPVLDDALDLAVAVPRRLLGAVLRRPSLAERRKEQREAAARKELELVSRARVEFARWLEARASGEVAGKLYREIVTVDYFDRDLASAWSAGADARRAAVEEWLARFEGELASKIEEWPKLRVTLQALKGILELGAGVAAVALTPGFGAADVIVSPAATKGAQMVLTALGREYFRSKREEYVRLLRKTFADGLDEVFLGRLRRAVPASPRAEDVDMVERELAWLARAFPASGPG